jgi:hypothetical protein
MYDVRTNLTVKHTCGGRDEATRMIEECGEVIHTHYEVRGTKQLKNGTVCTNFNAAYKQAPVHNGYCT